MGAVRGRRGLVGGTAQIIEQQVPDELLRLGRRVRGTASLEAAVRGRVVMVTGASSGIGKLGGAARSPTRAASSCSSLARAEKLEETKATDRGRRRHGLRPRVRPLRHGRHRPHGRRGPRPARPRRRPRQQRRALDPPLDRPLLRPLPRLRADHAAQLLRRGEADPEAAAGDARAALRPDRQRQLDRRADEHAALLRLRGVEGGARRVLALHRLGDHRRRGVRSRRSTCRWCGRR